MDNNKFYENLGYGNMFRDQEYFINAKFKNINDFDYDKVYKDLTDLKWVIYPIFKNGLTSIKLFKNLDDFDKEEFAFISDFRYSKTMCLFTLCQTIQKKL